MKLSIASLLAFAVVAKAAAEAEAVKEQTRELYGPVYEPHYKPHYEPHQEPFYNEGCCIFDEYNEFCGHPPGDKYNWCSQSEHRCSYKCGGRWSDKCEKKEPGCCYQKWGGGHDEHYDQYDSYGHDGHRQLWGDGGHEEQGGCSSACWCNINEHNCWACGGEHFSHGYDGYHGDGGDGGHYGDGGDGGGDGGHYGDGGDGGGDGGYDGGYDGGGDGGGDGGYDGGDGGGDGGYDGGHGGYHGDGGHGDGGHDEQCFDCYHNNPCYQGGYEPQHYGTYEPHYDNDPQRKLYEPSYHPAPGYFPACYSGFFIQCGEWGQCFKMPCPKGQVWNTKENTCTPPGWPYNKQHYTEYDHGEGHGDGHGHPDYGHGHGHGAYAVP